MAIPVTVIPDADGSPRAFVLGDRRRQVAAVLDRWPGTGHLYVKLRAEDGGTYILRREDATGRWQLWLYQGKAGPEPPPPSGA